MLYTWDEEKRKANRAKHGVDLADAAVIFEDFCLIREDVTEGYAEQRFLAIGRAGGRMLMVVYTLPDEDTISIISARRADRPERRRYLNMPSNLDDPINYSDIPKQTAEEIRQFKPMQDVSPALYRKLQTAHMGKTMIMIRLDNEVLDWFRNHVIQVGGGQADGGDYQALINDALREYMRGSDLKATLRQIIREEMKAAG